MNPHFFTAPFYFAFIWFRVQGSGFRVSESSLDRCFPFLQPVHEERGEGGEDAEDDEDPADRGGEEDGNVVARKGEASPQATLADRP